MAANAPLVAEEVIEVGSDSVRIAIDTDLFAIFGNSADIRQSLLRCQACDDFALEMKRDYMQLELYQCVFVVREQLSKPDVS